MRRGLRIDAERGRNLDGERAPQVQGRQGRRKPEVGLIFDPAGNLYGTTLYGGNNDCRNGNLGCGVVFELTRQTDGSWAESVLHRFDGQDGYQPYSDLIFDTAGNLYGATAGGGAQEYGTVFKLTPNSNGKWTETVLHRFVDRPGDCPFAGLIFDASGNL